MIVTIVFISEPDIAEYLFGHPKLLEISDSGSGLAQVNFAKGLA